MGLGLTGKLSRLSVAATFALAACQSPTLSFEQGKKHVRVYETLSSIEVDVQSPDSVNLSCLYSVPFGDTLPAAGDRFFQHFALDRPSYGVEYFSWPQDTTQTATDSTVSVRLLQAQCQAADVDAAKKYRVEHRKRQQITASTL